MSSPTWDGAPEPDFKPLSAGDYLRVLLRGLALVVLVFGGLALLLLLRQIERPLCGANRPVTPHITVFVCRNALRFLGMRFAVHGVPLPQHGAMVANHASWLDIFSLNASTPIYFVSKAEVAGWFGIGWLARATGTVFIDRDRRRAKEHTQIIEDRLLAGHKLMFFPEGTSTDGLQVIPFKTTLFEPLLNDHLRNEIWVQPVSVIYHAPPGESRRFYGWWGDMEFGAHLLHTLAARRQGGVTVAYHTPIRVAEAANRKQLAARAEAAVRAGHIKHLQ